MTHGSLPGELSLSLSVPVAVGAPPPGASCAALAIQAVGQLADLQVQMQVVTI
jgi:hypothetical protein